MLTISGFALLCVLYKLCDLFVKYFGIPFPGALLAMLILFFLLSFGVLPIKFIEGACKALLSHMPLYFVPILVGLIAYRQLLSENAFGIFGSVMISTVLTLSITGILVEKIQNYRLQRLQKNGVGRKKDV